MILAINRYIPDQIVSITINTDYFIFGYKVIVGGKKSCLVKMEDCDMMNITEESFDMLISAINK